MDTVITNALIVDHAGIVKADIGLRDGRIAAIGKAGNPDTQPGVTIIIGPGTEIIAGEGKILTAGGIDSHIHFISPQQIEEALDSGVTTMLGGGTGPAHGTLATTCTGAWHTRAHDRGGGRLPDESRLHGQGQCLAARGAGGDDPGRRLRPEAARGLGHHARRHRLLPLGRRRVRRAGGDPHRHAERVGLRRGHDRRLQGPHHPHLPHRGRRRRPRARHHQGGEPAQRAALLHQSDAALHGQHGGRASRHADGLPSSRARASPRTSPSPKAASARRPSRRRTSCTISAPSR